MPSKRPVAGAGSSAAGKRKSASSSPNPAMIGVVSHPPNGMIVAASVCVVRLCSTVVTLPPCSVQQVLTLCNANDSPDVTGIALLAEVTDGVMYVVDLATNRSDVYAARWSRRTLRHVNDWSADCTTDRSGGAWSTQRESKGPVCD